MCETCNQEEMGKCKKYYIFPAHAKVKLCEVDECSYAWLQLRQEGFNQGEIYVLFHYLVLYDLSSRGSSNTDLCPAVKRYIVVTKLHVLLEILFHRTVHIQCFVGK